MSTKKNETPMKPKCAQCHQALMRTPHPAVWNTNTPSASDACRAAVACVKAGLGGVSNHGHSDEALPPAVIAPRHMTSSASFGMLPIPTLLPGITVNTSQTNYHPIRKSQLARWNGKNWELFGNVIEGAGTS